MKKKWTLALVFALVAALAACAGMAPFSLEPEGMAVIDYVSKTDDYKNWQLWPGKGKLYKGTQPHGVYLTTYLNDKAYDAVSKKSGKLPDGAIVVKENYTPEKKLAAITVMYRKAGYNPESGDYYWIKYGPDGTIMKEGKVAGCINCHAKVKANDWLYTGPIK